MRRPVPSAERLSRLLALVPWLSAHRGVTISEAAEHFGVDSDQLVEDLNLLICSGLPGYGPEHLVDIQFWDEDEEIHVLDPQTLTAPMRLTSEEVTALLVGLRVLAQVPGDHDRDALMSATAKLESAGGEFSAADQVDMSIAGSAEAARIIDEAIREGRSVRMTYAGITREDVTARTITPIRVLVGQGYTYVEAWCDLAEALRTFRLDRILECTLGEAAVRPAEVSAQEAATGQTVVLALQPSAWWVLETHGGRLLDESEGVRRVELDVADLEWAARLVLSLGGQAIAQAPEPLVNRIRVLAEAALAGYEASTPG